jgi:signal transduction histidine kinase
MEPEARRGARWTIGHELTLLVLGTLLPFAVLGAAWAWEDYRAEQAIIQGRALQRARAVACDVEGVSEGEFVDGRNRLSGFAPTSRVTWEVIGGIPTEEAHGALRRELPRTVTRLLAVGGLACLSAWLLSRRLTQPIRELVTTARAFASGVLSHRACERGPAEVAALASAMNAMAQTLAHQLAQLKVAQSREREAGKRSLAELHRLHSEFVAVAAHELRTPAAAAKSYAELLLRDDTGLAEETRRQALTRLNNVCDRLGHLVRSLLGASRIQAGGLDVECKPLDLGALAARVVQDVDASSGSHTIAFTSQHVGVVPIMGDAERVEDALVNLLVNSMKDSPSGSQIAVAITEPVTRRRMVELTVTDQVPGVSEDERANVVERFARGSNVAPAGVGLGLYIARAYIESMGGQIGVRDNAGGATFWVRLPRAPRTAGHLGTGRPRRRATPIAQTRIGPKSP